MGIQPEDLFRWIGDPPDGPMPFVMLTEGWIEASEAMHRVHETIAAQAGLEPIIEFDADQLIDQRARRPIAQLNDGVIAPLQWPKLQVAVGSDANEQPFLYLHGPEPDFNWRPFAAATATALQTIGVTTMYTIGAYPVPAPHTRPIRISSASTCAELLIGRDKTSGSLSIPVGIQMAVTEELLAGGVHTLGLYAQVPYYISTSPWPTASIDLLANLRDVAKLEFDTSMLEAHVAEAVQAVTSMLDETPSLASIVGELEQRYDDLRAIEEADLPSGDELEEELQQYLRDIDDGA